MAFEFKDAGILLTGGLSLISFLRLYRRDGVEEQKRLSSESQQIEKSLTVMQNDLKHVSDAVSNINDMLRHDINRAISTLDTRVTRIEARLDTKSSNQD